MQLERDCKHCGKKFKQNREWQKFCCPEHQKEYWRKIYKERYALTDRIEKLEEQLKASQADK